MKAIGNKLIAKQIDKGEQKRGDIILPTESMMKEQATECVVISAGKDVVEIKAGDVVLIDRYAQDTTRMTREGILYFLIEEHNVLAILP